MAKFYIATSLRRKMDHNKVRDALIELGHTITYDWTTHGSVKNESIELLSQVAENEMNGVLDADFVVVLLPGGKGTHTELGAAIAANKKIFIHSSDPNIFELGDQTVAFYHHPAATKICCNIDELDPILEAIEQALSALMA